MGDPSASGAIAPAGLLSPFALASSVVNRTTTTVWAALRCWHDTTNGAAPYIDGDASPWAHKAGGQNLAAE